MSTLQHDDLLTQGKILEKETLPPTKEADQHAETAPDETKHGLGFITKRWWSNRAWPEDKPGPAEVAAHRASVLNGVFNRSFVAGRIALSAVERTLGC